MNVIITFTVKEEKLDSFIASMEDVKENLPKAEGCQGVTVYRGDDNPLVFTLVESWASQQAHKSHIEILVADGVWDVVASHLQCDPVSGYFTKF